MKRLALIARPWTFHGGVETATAGLVRELVRQGVEVELVTTAGPAPLPDVRRRILPVIPRPSVARLWSFALAARRAVREGGHDLVQSHERVLRQDLYRAGEGTHRGYLEAMGRRARGDPYHQSVLYLERRIFSLVSARHIVTIAELGRAEAQHLYDTPLERMSTVYNGVDLQRFTPANRERFRRQIREELGLPLGSWVVLFAGSGFERKGLRTVLEGLASLGDREARLVVAGKGRTDRYRDIARSLGIGERVRWLSPRPDVERLYAMADLLALPARYEPFGNVHLEALASGVPVLSSARAGGSELIRQGENGWVVRRIESGEVRLGLEALRQADPARLAAGARRAAEPFTHAAQVEGFRAVYRTLERAR
ncbi:MAG: glycosyltransferase family 4 protein [Candidatus Rokubacteria bacterium]|nr:glycosyltransferase family 4 protein [Candidatus Rokubacteria bacterium]